MKVFLYEPGGLTGKVVTKDPAVARRLITIGAARVPLASDMEAAPQPVEVVEEAAPTPKRRKGRR